MGWAEEHPEAWEFFIEQARNIKDCPEVNHNGKYAYRIPVPDMSGNFIYAESCPSQLVSRFLTAWFKPSMSSHSMRGRIQYIVETFKH